MCANDPMTSGLLSSGSHFFPMTETRRDGRVVRLAPVKWRGLSVWSRPSTVEQNVVLCSATLALSSVGASAMSLSNSGFVHPWFTVT